MALHFWHLYILFLLNGDNVILVSFPRHFLHRIISPFAMLLVVIPIFSPDCYYHLTILSTPLEHIITNWDEHMFSVVILNETINHNC